MNKYRRIIETKTGLKEVPTAKWTIGDALVIVGVIQKEIREKWGYNVCLYGSVLYHGYSLNDLDIQLIPWAHTDKYADADILAAEVAKAVGGEVMGSMKLKARGEMCYIIEFHNDDLLHRIDMVIRRVIPYVPSEEEIIAEYEKVMEKRKILGQIMPQTNGKWNQNLT